MLAQQASTHNTPRFEDYPVTETFTGTPAAPILDTSEQRMFRTRIRNGALKGEGVVDSITKRLLTKPGSTSPESMWSSLGAVAHSA